MSRITPVTAEQAPLAVRAYFAKGSPGPIGASLAQVPELMEAAMPLISRGLAPGAIGARMKELVIVRTSALQRCVYCTQTHAAIALGAAVTPEEIQVLQDAAPGQASGAFEDVREAALLDWTDIVALGPAPVTHGDHEALATHFSEPEIVELAVALTVTLMLNRFCTALALPVSAGSLRKLADAGLLEVPKT